MCNSMVVSLGVEGGMGVSVGVGSARVYMGTCEKTCARAGGDIYACMSGWRWAHIDT